MKRIVYVVLAVMLVATLFVACSSNNTPKDSSPNKTGASSDPNGTAEGESIKGEITFIHHRTDLNDNVFKDEYIPRFNEKYPDIKVSLETMTDYAGQIKIRMNTADYGDVLMIPGDMPKADLPHFFEPLGDEAEMSETYLFLNDHAYEGKAYGIPIVVNAEGIMYNKKVFEQAGVTKIPATPDEFIEAMQKIKDNTDAIPYYTNYAAGWPLDQWGGSVLAIAGDEEYNNYKMVNEDDPFAPGKPHYILYKLMYDLAANGLIEEDPLTTDWESSKVWIGEGKIGAMVLGSWAISQAQELAENPDDIGYMPFPYTIDGKSYAASGGDYNLGINVNSKHKDAARAWVDWFTHESGFAKQEGGISPVAGGELPETLSAFDELGVIYISDKPNPDQEGFLDQIDNESEVGLWNPAFKERIIEAAIANRSESYDDIMQDLNERWNTARAKIVN